MANSTDFVDVLSILGSLAGNVLATSDLPRERALGALVAGGSQIPDVLQHRAFDRQQAAGQQQALHTVRARLEQPIPVTPRPVNVPVGSGQTGSAVLDMPATRRPTPAELTDRLGNLIKDPGWVMQLSKAGVDVPAAATSAVKTRAQVARERRQSAQELAKNKLALLKELRNMRLPQGARSQIHKAQTFDDLIRISGAIEAHQGLNLESATPARIAWLAAGPEGAEQQRALKALKLLSPGEQRGSISKLADLAAGGDQQAAKAIEILKDLRRTGVGRRGRTTGSEQFSPPPPPPLQELPGGDVQGIARPRVKSFRRLP